MMGLMSSQDADLFSDDEVPSRRPVLASPSVQALPTPAKEDPDPDDYPRVVRPSLVQLSAEVSPSLPLTTKESDTDARRLPSATQTAHIEGPCPNLWCGRRLNKSVVLLPNTWITLGKEGCHVKLPSRMVSTKHCQLRWVSAARQVEFVDTSTNGTWVSGEKVYRNRKEPKLLEHGARVVIENDPPENRFNFVLDLRPTGLAFADPRQLPRGVDRPKQELEREKWKKHLFSLRMRQDKQESDILEKEKFYHELQVQRRELEAKTQLWQGEIERLKEDTEMVLKKMFEKRDAWKAKLQELYKANEEVTVPLTQRTIEKQDQVHQLEGKVSELQRLIYPDRFSLAQFPEADKAKGALTEDETDHEEASQSRKEPFSEPEEDAATASAKFKDLSAAQQSSGYAPTTPAKTPAPEDSAAYQHDSAPAIDSATFAEEAVPFLMELTMQEFPKGDEEEPAEPAAKRLKTDDT
ncbi:Hypothetical protein (Fragment) [Durusdinium trenchii]|uniref:FHA domain-containing protein n=1 Tax=Durusdinium trenchii TaxID=1381693 RepID=A0ABP0RQS5_9DINO